MPSLLTSSLAPHLRRTAASPRLLSSSSPSLPPPPPLHLNPLAVNTLLVDASRSAAPLASLLSLHSAHGSKFTGVNWATLASSLGRIRGKERRTMVEDGRLERVVEEMAAAVVGGGSGDGRKSPVFKPRQLSQILNFAAGLSSSTSSFSPEVAAIAEHAVEVSREIVEEGSAQSVANVAHSLAVIYSSSSPSSSSPSSSSSPPPSSSSPSAFFFSSLNTLPLATRFLVSAKPQEISSLLWSAATLNHPLPNVYSLLPPLYDFLLNSPLATPQSISNTVWAHAKQRQQCRGLFDIIDLSPHRLLSKGGTQEVSNTLWAAATLGTPLPSFFAILDHPKSASSFVDNADPREIAQCLWAATKLGASTPNLLRAVDGCSDWFVESSPLQSIASVALAFAGQKKHEGGEKQGREFFAAVEKSAARIAASGNPFAVGNVASALATLEYDAPLFASALSSNASSLLSQCGEREAPVFVSMALRMYAVTDRNAEGFLDLLRGDLLRTGATAEMFERTADGRTLGLTLWSLAILGVKDNEELVRELWRVTLEKSERDRGFLEADEALNMLRQVEVFAAAERVELEEPMGEDLKRRVNASISRLPPNATSGASRRVSALLTDMGFEHEEEAVVLTGAGEAGMFLAVDMANFRKKIAVEFDGPSHFLTPLSSGDERIGRETGPTVSKRKLLQGLGWKVMNYNYLENRRLTDKNFLKSNARHGTPIELKEIFLRNKFEAVGAKEWKGGG